MEPLFTQLKAWGSNGLGIIPTPHKKIFLSLFFTIFSTVTGVGIVIPLLPVYAHDLGASGIYVAMIFGAFSLSRTVLLPIFGKLSDQKGRKPFIVIGLFCHILVSAAFIFSKEINSLIIIRFLQGITSAMIMPVVQAYVGEITPDGKEGHAMGLFNLSMFASLSLGPLMGGIIKDAWSMDAAFSAMGILSALGMGLAITCLPNVKKEQMKLKKGTPVSLTSLVQDKNLFALFSFRFFYTACIGIIWCFLPLFAENRFNLSGSSTGVLLMLAVFISGLLQLPMGYVADRINTKLMVSSGGILCSAAMLLLYTATSYLHLLFAASLFGLGGGIAMPAIMALSVLKGNEKGAMASVMSIVTAAHSMGMMAGSLAAGMAMDYFELAVVFPFGTLLMAAGVLSFHIFTSSKK